MVGLQEKDCNLVVLQRSAALPMGLKSALTSKGYTLHFVTTPEEILPVASELRNPIIFIESGTDEDHALELLKSLIKIKALHSCPLGVIGRGIDGYEGVIEKYFSQSVLVSLPCESQDVLGALSYLVRSYQPPDFAAPAAEPFEPDGSDTEAFAEQRSTQIFDGIVELNGDPLSLGGHLLKRDIDFGKLEKDGLLPSKENLLFAAQQSYEESHSWGRGHLCRTNFISSRLNDALKLSQPERELAKAASLLYACAFSGSEPRLLRDNYLRDDTPLRRELCSRVKDSAMRIATELGEPDLGNIVADMARVMGKENGSSSDEQLSQIVSSVVGADLLDRICYSTGLWNPRGANYLMRKVKSGDLDQLHFTVLSCLIKFLNEAVESLPKNILLPRGTKRNKEFMTKRLEWQRYEPAENELKLELTELRPGMRLTKPLCTFDGREILAEDLLLDQDMIWRLWQLSSICLLNTPVVVRTQ